MSAYSTAVLADSPILYARLGEASGTSFADSSTNANTGTGANIGTLGAPSLIAQDSANTAITVVSTASPSILFPNIAAYAVADIVSVEGWVKGASLAGDIASFGTGGICVVIASGQIVVNKSQTSQICATTGLTLSDGNAHHVVVTKSGATVKVYADAVDVTPAITNATLVSTTHGIRVCSDMSGSGAATTAFFNGTLDEVAVYATALSSTRVTAHYNAATQAGGGATSGSAAGGHNFPTSILINS